MCVLVPAGVTPVPAADQPMPSHTVRQLPRGSLAVALGVAVVWRVVLAVLMPLMTRDGATFCWYAQDLATLGLDHLRDPATHQHPLFPATILAVHSLLRAIGLGESPVLWQISGQVIALSTGVAVVWLAARLARRLAIGLNIDQHPDDVAAATAMLAAVLPLGTRLSADVMSDHLCLAFYLWGALGLLHLRSVTVALGIGLAGGLAFLTRPEGATLIPAALAVLLMQWRSARVSQMLLRGGVVLVGFVIMAAPYWFVTGKLSPKKDPLELISTPAAAQCEMDLDAAVAAARAPAAGRLVRHEMNVIESVGWAFWQMLRAGRGVIPILALIALAHAVRLLRHPAVVGLTACFTLHFALLVILQNRYGYLNPRHALLLILLLMPWAAMTLVGLRTRLATRRLGGWWWPATLALLLPLMIYASRIPNAHEAHFRTAAEWLRSQDPAISDKLLMSGMAPARIAFYAGCAWTPWFEDDPYAAAVLRRQLPELEPDYLAIEVGRGFERVGNAELLTELLQPQVAPGGIVPVRQFAAGEGNVLHLLKMAWPATQKPTTSSP